MSIFKRLNAIVRRSSLLTSVFALVAATVAPALVPLSTYADALNPLTNRSLTLSSSSPGWSHTDGSGNTNYAPPNSGANGQKTGNTFSFNVSSDSQSAGTTAVSGFTFQYCTAAGGDCYAPGNNDPTYSSATDTANSTTTDAAQHADLDVVGTGWTEFDSSQYSTYFDSTTGDAKSVPTVDMSSTPPDNPTVNTDGQYIVEYKDGSTWVPSTGWAMTAINKEAANPDASAGHQYTTGMNNYIQLIDSGSGATGLTIPTGAAVKIIFFAGADDYITNPGAGAFFVKINDYGVNGSIIDNTTSLVDSNIIDGGVTVANVMNQSIEIQTKVLETMDFSVGTVDPDTLSSADGTGTGNHVDSSFQKATGGSQHGICNPIVAGLTAASDPTAVQNTLVLGDAQTENALNTRHTYSTHSYFRLSSNSSKGAVVYYSGETLSDTEGDQIAAIGTTPHSPSIGTPQFGLALDNTQDGGTGGKYQVDYATEDGIDETAGGTLTGAGQVDNSGKGSYEQGADNDATGVSPTVAADTTGSAYHAPQLYPLVPDSANGSAGAANSYAGGTGSVNASSTDGTGYGAVDTYYAFDPNSDTVPTPLASESNEVVDCVTGKIRYIADIAATTPAGIYTTKINYIAAPQY